MGKSPSPCAGREGEGVVVTDVKTKRYSELLASSTFCGVLPGWGWSGRMEDAVLHGCIPVVLQDGVHIPYQTSLPSDTFSIRLTRQQMPQIVEILRAVPSETIGRMQATLREVWPRFSYLGSYVAERARRAKAVGARPPSRRLQDLASRDAVATLILQLKKRLEKKRARQAGQLAAASPGCEVLTDGLEVSPRGGDEGAKFEERQVGNTGWVI